MPNLKLKRVKQPVRRTLITNLQVSSAPETIEVLYIALDEDVVRYKIPDVRGIHSMSIYKYRLLYCGA